MYALHGDVIHVESIGGRRPRRKTPPRLVTEFDHSRFSEKMDTVPNSRDPQSIFSDVYENKSVLVTGHTGFKGSWLALWLTKLGAEVTGYALPPVGGNSNFDALNLKSSIRHVEGDIRDPDRLIKVTEEARPEFVFHLAAQALVREAYRDPKTTFDTNVGGSVNVLETVRRCESVRTLIYVTSDKCYRNMEWEWGYRENDRLGGTDPYGASKGCAEIVFDSYMQSYLLKQGRVRAASARSGNVIGGGDWAEDRIVPDCIRALREDRAPVIRNPDAIRPWQHVLEAIGAYLLLGSKLHDAQDDKLCTSWNFGPDRSSERTVEELVGRIIEVWGSGEFEVEHDADAPREATLLRLNCDKAHNLLGWAPTWGFSEAVTHTIDWYKAFAQGANMRDICESLIDLYEKEWMRR
jgi:CDP-glucose 4,6-dehydratase